MRMYDILAKKRDGGTLAAEEIAFVIAGYTSGEIPDYQMAAFLMAVFLRGMDKAETAVLTDCMARSGDVVDLSAIAGVKVDKHSTGGVGDKTTLVVAPLAAACGVKVAKMSGRGLGHTGGTVDKMEAIPHMRTTLSGEEFIRQVNEIGLAVIGQSGNLAPADKKMYALRDVTATVNSIPLIASSIMSKKLAAGSDAILLDVKTGSGAFMKTLEDSIALAAAMVDIGEANGRRTAALITSMDAPLGHAIGNSLEVAEAVATLQGRGPADLTEVCLELCAGMLALAGQGTHDDCRAKAEGAIADGSGFARLRQMVAAQGGDASVIDDASRFAPAVARAEVAAPVAGYITGMDTEGIGTAAMLLGAGRATKEDEIDYAAGMVLHAKTGAYVQAGAPLATLYAADEKRLGAGREKLLQSISFGEKVPALAPLVLARVDKDGVRQY
ncbi:pyrimidine-nucleoside phosphorylase [Ruminococcaceae bacterium OttesenSCG-928-O06]|nr:pyrimidine-nucleoside phosphorylase [Ruminococcaceae bacterium OttesenSCG-928-O06]